MKSIRNIILLTSLLVLLQGILHSQTATQPLGAGTQGDPYLIANLNNLYWISASNVVVPNPTQADRWNSHYLQLVNIDAADTYNWNSGAGFSPIGNLYVQFTGTYNGNGLLIDNLTINRGGEGYIGLFGFVSGGANITGLHLNDAEIHGNDMVGSLTGYSLGSISNCAALGGSVNGHDFTGGLVGDNEGTIDKCYTDIRGSGPAVYGSSIVTGGLVGLNNGTISNCYSRSKVTGDQRVGGLVGTNGSGVSINNSYSTGYVSGSIDHGGLVGYNNYGSVNNSFWDTQTSNQSTSAGGGTGLLTTQMKEVSPYLNAGWTFTQSGSIWAINGTDNEGYPYFRWQGMTSSHIWLGTTSTTWNTAGNWSENSIPSQKVIIPDITNDPVIASGASATCTNLTVETNGSLTIQSDASGTGSIIVSGTSTGNVIFKRYVDEASSKGYTWHYVSSPVAGQTLNDTWMTNNNIATSGTYEQFFRWDEDQNYWIIYGSIGNPEAFTDATFIEARGYCLTRSNAGELSFTGTVRTGDVDYLTTYTSGEGDGFNLVGNPFTSSIGVTNSATTTGKFLFDNTALLDNSYEALYIWDEQTFYQYGRNDYKVISNGAIGTYIRILQDYIQPGQAFMVKVVSPGGNLAFNENMQAHATVDFFKNDKELWPSVELIVENDQLFNSTAIGFNENMTKGLDPSYDVGKLKGNPDIALYTKLIEDNGVDFAIQALPYFEQDYSVKVGLDITNTGEYTFEVATMEQIPDEVYVYFDDKLTGTVTDLKETDNYTCVINESGSITNRFVLHFTLTPFSTDEINANQSNIQIWSSNKTINILNPENLKGQIRIVNVYGQKLVETRLNGNERQQITINIPTGNYIVNIVNNSFSVSKKIFVK